MKLSCKTEYALVSEIQLAGYPAKAAAGNLNSRTAES